MIAPAVPTPEEWPETLFAGLIEAGVWLFDYVTAMKSDSIRTSATCPVA